MGLWRVTSGYTEGVEYHLPIEASPTAVRQVRQAVARTLEGWGVHERIDDVQLVVSELVTNAIRHGIGPIEVGVACKEGRLRLEVIDADPDHVPAPADANDLDAGGRGLTIIEALSFTWGVEPRGDKKVVWAEIPFVRVGRGSTE